MTAEEEKEIGNKNFKKGLFKEAIDHYTRGLSFSNTNSILFGNRGLCYFKMLEFEKCILDCDKALEINPRYTKAYLRRALSKFYLGCFSDALDDFKTTLKFDTNKFSIIECELYIKKIEFFISEKNRNKDDIILQIEREETKSETKQKNLKLALSDVQNAIKMNQNNEILYQFYFMRGKVYQEMHDYQQSLYDFQTSIELNKKESNDEIKKYWKKSKIFLIKQTYKSATVPTQSSMKKISKDEEIIELLKDPFIQKCFKNVTKNPKIIKKYLKNEKFKSISDIILQKLK
eukprot:gene5609-9426_t